MNEMIWQGMKLIRVSSVEKEFGKWMRGQTFPYVEEDDDPYDWAYAWDYERFKKGLPIVD